eukprot:2362460-Pleurochrysis_carterae.AAC.1
MGGVGNARACCAKHSAEIFCDSREMAARPPLSKWSIADGWEWMERGATRIRGHQPRRSGGKGGMGVVARLGVERAAPVSMRSTREGRRAAAAPCASARSS